MQDAKNRRLGTIAQLCRAISSQLGHVSTIGKLVNFSLLAAKIISLAWGTPANFNGFCVLASLLQQRHSMEANQTLHSVWPLPGLVEYMYIHFRRLLLRNRILPGAKFTLRPPSLALSY